MKLYTFRFFLICLCIPLFVAAIGLAADEKYSDPPIDLLIDNINTTDETVVLELVEAFKISEEGVYETWKFVATVVRSFKGELDVGEKIEYFRTMENGLNKLQIGSQHIVSFIWKDSRLHIPDVGYHFEFSRYLEKKLVEELLLPSVHDNFLYLRNQCL